MRNFPSNDSNDVNMYTHLVTHVDTLAVWAVELMRKKSMSVEEATHQLLLEHRESALFPHQRIQIQPLFPHWIPIIINIFDPALCQKVFEVFV